jgi:voltage-gated potassium channel
MAIIKSLGYIVGIIIVFIFGISGTYVLGHYEHGFNVPINSLLDAAYFTTITLATVGYGDVVPVTNIAKIFVMVLIISGIGVFITSVTVITGEFVNSRMEKYSGRLSGFERRLLKNHVVLIGVDSVNLRLAERLKNKKAKFLIITSDKTMLDHLRSTGYKAYLADETNEDDMKNFELGKAKAIIMDMRDKSRMVYAILLVRNLAKDSRIVTVAHTKEEERNTRSMGVSIGIINPADLASEILAKKLIE